VSSTSRKRDNKSRFSEVSDDVESKRYKSSSSWYVSLHSADKDLERVNKNDMEQINKMDPSLSGRGAATIYRDNVGMYT